MKILSIFLILFALVYSQEESSEAQSCRKYVATGNAILGALHASLSQGLDELADALYNYEQDNSFEPYSTYIQSVNPFWTNANATLLEAFNNAKRSIADNFGVTNEIAEYFVTNFDNLEYPFNCIKFIFKQMRDGYFYSLDQAAYTVHTLADSHMEDNY